MPSTDLFILLALGWFGVNLVVGAWLLARPPRRLARHLERDSEDPAHEATDPPEPFGT